MVLYSSNAPDLTAAIGARKSLKVPKHPPKTIWPINGRNHDICVYITPLAQGRRGKAAAGEKGGDFGIFP